MTGKFIVVEGLEGAGKTTAVQQIEKVLQAQGITDILHTREPGGTPLAEKMRALIKEEQAGDPLTDTAELLLLYAARSQVVENVIKPNLVKGYFIIGDRHDMSSQAYQGGGREVELHKLNQLRDMVLGDFKPHLTIYMDLAPEVGLARARARGELDRIEKMQLDFFERTRKRYLALAEQDAKVIIIDASKPIEAVKAAIEKAMLDWLAHECK